MDAKSIRGIIIRGANICEAHRDVVEKAYEEEDINYLFVQWQELIAEPQIKRLQAVIHEMLGIPMRKQIASHNAPIDPKNS